MFNILCVGETGIGKSTLMESLFNMPLDLEPCEAEADTVQLRKRSYDISELVLRDLGLRAQKTAKYKVYKI